MLDLDIKAAHEFWHKYDDPMLYKVIAYMETAETWTLDGDPSLEAALKDLTDAINALSTFELGHEEQFVQLCAHLKTSRILRLLQGIDSIDPGSASKVLMYAEEHNNPDNIMASLFLRRNIIFERLRLLGRIFSRERLELVQRVLEGGV